MTIKLSSTDLKDISDMMESLNDMFKDNIMSDVVMQWPESFPFTLGSTIVGEAKFDGDLEQWLFEPLGNFPPPPTF